MTPKLLPLCAILAWSGAVLSTATPVSAFAYTAQTGAYAACSSSYQTIAPQCMCWRGLPDPGCGSSAYYTQIMKFQNTHCSAGACTYGSISAYTDMIYAVGRKTTTSYGYCGFSGMNWYGLDTCAC